MKENICVSLCAFCAVFCAGAAHAAFERTIPAPGGIGDVVALTNALTVFNALPEADDGAQIDRRNARIYLEPGLYDLRGIHMTGVDHLLVGSSRGLIFAGLGKDRGDTVLLGGGEAEGRRVLRFGGGGNYWWTTVSNLTVTGGYAPAGQDGGAISGSGTTRYVDLIITNNFASGSNAGGGGGCFQGRAYGCLFADNTVGTGFHGGGAFYISGKSGLNNWCQGAWDCVFSNNTAVTGASRGGGAVFSSGGQIEGCLFVGNKAPSGSGAAICCGSVTSHVANTTLENFASNCVFVSNEAYYGTVKDMYAVKDCVFAGNAGTEGATANGGNLYRCVMTNNSGGVYKCNLYGCYIGDNAIAQNGVMFDCGVKNAAGELVYTNVNCVFKGNHHSSYGGNVTYRKVVVNCTYVGNTMDNGNYDAIVKDSAVYNSVLAGNVIGGRMLDIKTEFQNSTHTVDMHNTVYLNSDTDDPEQLVDCHKATDMKFVPGSSFVPSWRSPAYGFGAYPQWIADLAGDVDFLGNARVLHGSIDAGAVECPAAKPGTKVILR